MNYCIWVVSPTDYQHSRAFDETALALAGAFIRLGYDAPIVRRPQDIAGRPIILGGNLLPHIGHTPPEGAIIFNLEQIQPGSPWLTADYLALLMNYEVWDFSLRNISTLKSLGLTKIKQCGLGYDPGLSRIKQGVEDIDVLFYGSINERRATVLQGLHRRGVRVEGGFGLYGEERDLLIARSKIVINIHFYDAKVFEIVRVSYLLANRRFVISETGLDQELEEPLAGGLVFAPYQNLVEECLRHLRDADRRDEIARRGFELFSARDQADLLKAVLEAKA